MPWPLPAPGDISGRAAGVYEREFARIYALRNPGAPPAIVDARSPNSSLAVHGRVIELSGWDIYLYQGRLAQELMPDTAVDWLPRHAAIWGVPQDQPTAAAGNVVATSVGPVDTVVAIGTNMTAPTGVLYTTTAAVTLPASGTVSLPVVAVSAGSAGNLPTGTVLTFVSAVDGLAPQTAAVDANGITDGQDIEAFASWRARILQRIQQRGGGGTITDYIQWTGQVLQNAMLNPLQLSLGFVNVIMAVNQGPTLPPRVPTDTELAVVAGYLNDATQRKPLGVTVYVTAATLVAVNFALQMNPNTVTVQNAALAVLALWFYSNAEIGGTLEMSQIDAALSNGSGEVSHDRSAPSSDETFTSVQLPILGTVTFS